jgi:protein SCO1
MKYNAYRVLLCCLCITLSACGSLQTLFAPTPTSAPSGVAIDPPKQMPDFTLTDTNAKPVKLSELRGKVVMIFFGYTHCPDICPFSLASFRLVKRELGTDASRVQFVMISVDGTRDTPEILGRYVKAFDTDFIGLTGDENDVRKIGLNYGVHFEKQQPTGTEAAYLVAHTTYTYLLDAQGQWRMVFPFKTPVESVAADIRKVINSSQ